MKKLLLILVSFFVTVGAMAQINYGKHTWTLPATDHEDVSSVPEEIFTDFKANYTDTDLSADKVGVFTSDVRVNAQGDVTVWFDYRSGNKRMDIGGVDLVDAQGNVVYSDYHFGFAGGDKSDAAHHTYTLSNVPVGDYLMRLFITTLKEDIVASGNNSQGYITLTGAWMYPNASTVEGTKHLYYIKNVRSNKYANYRGVDVQVSQESTPGYGSYWYFVEAGLENMKENQRPEAIPEGYKAYWVYNAGNELPVENVANGKFEAVDASPYPAKIYYVGVHTNGGTGLVIRPYNEDGASWNDSENKGEVVSHWSYDDHGSLWSIEVANVLDSDLIAEAETAKTNAIAAIDQYSSAYYYNILPTDADAAKSEIQNIGSTLHSAVSSLMQNTANTIATELINASAVTPKEGDRFIMKNRDGRGYMRAYADSFVRNTNSATDFSALDLVWQLVATDNAGQFKLYNECKGVYIGAFDANATNNGGFLYKTSADEAGLFELVDNNGFVSFHIVGGGIDDYMHATNHEDKKVIKYNNTDIASHWQLLAAPFELTTDPENPICYAIKSARPNGEFYFTFESNKIKLYSGRNIATDAATHWFFMLDDDKNLKLYPLNDKSNSMGYVTVADGNTKLTNNHDDTNFAGDTYSLYFSEANAATYANMTFALRPTTGDTYVSNHGGTGNFMGFYNIYDDHGTRIAFECVANATLTQKIQAWEAYWDYEGEDVGQYILPEGVKEVVDNSYPVIYAKNSTSAEYVAALEAVSAFEFPSINKPQPGNFWRIGHNLSGTLNYVQGEGSSIVRDSKNTLLISTDNNEKSIFYHNNDNLLAYAAGTYVNENGTARGLMAVGAAGGTVTFEEGNAIGTYCVKAPSYFHANASNGVNFIDHCGSAENVAAHNFILEKVTTLPLIIGEDLYAIFAAPVAVTIPESVTVYCAHQVKDGNLEIYKVSGTIPANTPVIVKAEAAGTYNLEIADEADAVVFAEETATSVLVTTTGAINLPDGAYTLQMKDGMPGMYPSTDATAIVKSFSAYMPAEVAASTAGYAFKEVDDPTGIEEIVVETPKMQGIYDLQGRRLSAPVKGINIINGKKVLVK